MLPAALAADGPTLRSRGECLERYTLGCCVQPTRYYSLFRRRFAEGVNAAGRFSVHTVALRLTILGSGSNGNAAFIATERVRILIDAGFSYRQISKRLAEIGESPENLDAVVVSHEHSDHVAGLKMLAKRTRASFWMTRLTSSTLDWGDLSPAVETFDAGARLVIGDLEIDTFTIPHDAIDPIGFRVRHAGVKLGLVTDLGYIPQSVKHHIRGCEFLLLESNHDLDMLKVGPYPWVVKQRVASRTGHLSNQSVAEFLRTDYDRLARTIVLAHLSAENNYPATAELEVGRALEDAGAADTRLLVAAQDRPSEVFQF